MSTCRYKSYEQCPDNWIPGEHCPYCTHSPHPRGTVSITAQELWDQLSAMTCPAGQPRVIPAANGANAQVSPLTWQGDRLWELVVLREPFPDNPVQRERIQQHYQQQQLSDKEYRTMLEYDNQRLRTDLQAFWWEGRQCFWHADFETWCITFAKVVLAQAGIVSTESLLRELDSKADFANEQLPLL